MANKAHLIGTIITEPEFSHESHNNKFWKTFISINRLSEINDVIPCILHDINAKEINNGARVEIFGEIRTRNMRDDSGNRHLDVYCFVECVDTNDVPDLDFNEVSLDGYITRFGETRKTPNGRIIKDILIASNRDNNYRSDYIPSIVWGRRAHEVDMLNITNHIFANGRIQSRNYFKVVNGEEETYTVYELSISNLGIMEDLADESID